MINLAISEKLSLRDNSEATVAYVAGLFDGEGSVCTYTYKGKEPGRKYAAWLEVCMCSEETVHWIKEHFGGSISVRKPKPHHSWKREQWHWKIPGDAAVAVLKMIYPFLITKKRQAALFFKFREVCKQTAWKRGALRTELRDKLMAE